MMIIRSYDGITPKTLHEQLRDFASYAELPWRRQARLCFLLIDLRVMYDCREQEANAVKNTAVAAKIGEMLQSIKRIADFSKSIDNGDAHASAAMLAVAQMGEIWAKHYSETLPVNFKPSRIAGADHLIDYGSAEVISSFFGIAATVHRIASDAQKVIAAEIDERPDQSGIVWAAGSRLPSLYEKFMGRFSIRTETTTDGISFVRKALQATAIRDDISVETVRSHYKTARRVKAP